MFIIPTTGQLQVIETSEFSLTSYKKIQNRLSGENKYSKTRNTLMHEVERQYNITQVNCKSKNESYQSLQRALNHVNGHQNPSL